MQIIFFIVGYFLIGLLLRRFVAQPNRLVQWINSFIIYLAFPALILLKVPSLTIDAKVLIPAAFVWGWAFITLMVVRWVARLWQWARDVEGASILLVSMGNTAFVGVPLSLVFFDSTVMGYAVFYDQLGSFLVLSTIGILVIARYAGHPESQPTTADITKRVLSFPPFLALLTALILPLLTSIDAMPDLWGQALGVLSAPIMPLALIVLGLQFQPQLLPHHRQPLLMVLLLKLLIAPALVLLVLSVVSVAPEIKIASVFQTAMPSMITPGLLAIAAGLAPRYISTALGYGTVIAFVSLPLWAWILGWQW